MAKDKSKPIDFKNVKKRNTKADLPYKEQTMPVTISGGDEQYQVDVIHESDENRIITKDTHIPIVDGKVQVSMELTGLSIDKVKIWDGTETAEVTESNELKVYQDKNKLWDGTNQANITDSNELKVYQEKIKLWNGTNTADVNSSNELKVAVDKTKIWDGTTQVNVTAYNELKVRDAGIPIIDDKVQIEGEVTLDKTKIWDGTTQANVTLSNELKVFLEKIKFWDGTNTAGITALSELKVYLEKIKFWDGTNTAEITALSELKVFLEKIKLWDGTNTAGITALNELKVSLDKTKIWDGTTQVNVTASNELKTRDAGIPITDNKVQVKAEFTDHQHVKVRGHDGLYDADVILEDGVRKLMTKANVSVESIFGYDDIADCWFFITGAGSAGDTIVTHIRQKGSVNYDTVTTTLTSNEAGNIYKTTDLVVTTLNANSTFKQNWIASKTRDNAIVHITSIWYADYGERSGANDFFTSTTGTTTTSDGQDRIIRKGKVVSLARDAYDKRYGMLGVSGEVQVTPGSIGETFDINALNGSSTSLCVNGSSTPVVFSIPAIADYDQYISEMKFYGAANGIKFGQFLAINAELTNGIEVKVKSGDKTRTFPLIKSTDDFKNKWVNPASNFAIHIQAGRDGIIAMKDFPSPFVIRKQGYYTTDDYIQVKIQDNLTTVMYLEFMVAGFKEKK
jgi:hypothetical protein